MMSRRLLFAAMLLVLSSCSEQRDSSTQTAAPPAETPAVSPADSAAAVAAEPVPAPAAAAPAGDAEQAKAQPAKAAVARAIQVEPATAEEILAKVHHAKSKAVLVNVWATWCGPCREEFPDLVRLYHDYRGRGLDLMLVSADFDDEVAGVKRFLARQGVDFGTYIKTGDDMKFINTMNPKWTGAIPATFLYDGDGHLFFFQEGMGTYHQFEKKVLQVLNAQGSDASKGVRS